MMLLLLITMFLLVISLHSYVGWLFVVFCLVVLIECLSSIWGSNTPQCGRTYFLTFFSFWFLACCLGFSCKIVLYHMRIEDLAWCAGLSHVAFDTFSCESSHQFWGALASGWSTSSHFLVHFLMWMVVSCMQCFTSLHKNMSAYCPRTKNRGYLGSGRENLEVGFRHPIMFYTFLVQIRFPKGFKIYCKTRNFLREIFLEIDLTKGTQP